MFHVLLSQLSRASQPPTEAMSRRSGVDPRKNESYRKTHMEQSETTFFVQNSNILTRFIKIFCFLSASEIFRRSDTWFRSRQCFEQNSRIALTNFCHDLTWLKISTWLTKFREMCKTKNFGKIVGSVFQHLPIRFSGHFRPSDQKDHV